MTLSILHGQRGQREKEGWFFVVIVMALGSFLVFYVPKSWDLVLDVVNHIRYIVFTVVCYRLIVLCRFDNVVNHKT